MNPWMRRLFALVLLAYPRDFREHYQASMSEHFESEGGGWSNALRTAAEILATAVSMRAEDVWRDLVYAVRMNVKAPLFALVIVGAIALSIATNTVAFALLDAVLLKPLPYPDAGQLGLVWQRTAQANRQVITTLSSGQVSALTRASQVFASVTAVMSNDTVAVSGGETLHREQVMTNYFSTLGIRPVLGRFLSRGTPARQVVISSALWHGRFGGDPHVIGRSLKLQGNAYTIVGVAPAGMLDPSFGRLVRSDVWMKLPHAPKGGDAQFPVFPIVRLRDGVSWQSAQADLTRIQHALKESGPPFAGSTYYTGPLDDSIFANARSFLWMVYAAVTGVLLIACANVANLLLVRGAVREGEFALRSAVGASARRIASQIFTETMLLAAAGASIGLAIAWAVLPWARSSIPGDFPRLHSASIDSSVLLYVVTLVVGVTLLTGMLPAYRRRQKGVRDASGRVGPVLAVIEIAVAFALTAGFGVMLHSFVSMTSVPLGFSPRGVYVANVTPKFSAVFPVSLRPTHPPKDLGIVRRIRAIPGVLGASAATGVPFQNAFRMTFGLSAGWNGQRGGPPLIVSAIEVGASYFRLMHIPILAGEGFTPADFSASTGSVAVNEAFARRYFPHGSVIGKHVHVSRKETWHVVALVGDTRSSFKQVPQPILYMPFNGGFGPYVGIVIRTAQPIPTLAKDVSAVINRAEPGVGTVTVSSLEDLVANGAAGMRTSLELLGALAGVALLLGLSGIYSVVAYGTQRRFHEIGIRMAVGARPLDIISLIVGGALVQGVLGVVLGVLLFALMTRLLASQLYKTSPLDPPTLLAVMVVLIACTAGAALVPACRAAFARPVSTLRYE